MNQYQHFTSLPPEQEQTFVVYEQRTQETAKKALTIGLITAGVFFLLTLVIVFSHDKPKNLMEGEDMGMLAGEKERAETREDMADKPDPAEAAPAAAVDDSGDTSEAEGSDDEASADEDE